MTIKFRTDDRKGLVKAIGDELGIKPKYLGVPSYSYEVGEVIIDKDCQLICDDREKALTLARTLESHGFKALYDLKVILPSSSANIPNLTALLEAKGDLIRKALGVADLTFREEEDNLIFEWFKNTDPQDMMTYTRFISALCDMSKKQRRINKVDKVVENEKYAFRCFLLRLGFIGDDTKHDRKILMRNLDGSPAFKGGYYADKQRYTNKD